MSTNNSNSSRRSCISTTPAVHCGQQEQKQVEQARQMQEEHTPLFLPGPSPPGRPLHPWQAKQKKRP